MGQPYIDQDSFAYFEDDNATPDSCTQIGSTNANPTITPDYNYNIRFWLRNTGAKPQTDGYRLFYRVNSGTWTQVTTTSSYVRSFASANWSDGDSVGQVISTGTYDEGYADSGGQVASYSITNGQESELVWNVQFRSADIAGTETIDLEIRYDNDGVIDNYTRRPTVTVWDIILPLVAAQGTYTISGQAATFKRDLVMIAAQGTYTFTGLACTFPVPGIVKTAVAQFVANTSSGNQDLTTSKLGGLTPKGAIFNISYATANGTEVPGTALSVGWVDSAGNAQAVSWNADDNVDPTDSGGRFVPDPILVADPADQVVEARGEFVSWITNGIRINWPVGEVPASAFRINAWFIAGDISTDVDSLLMNATVGQTASTTAPGFTPDMVFGMSLIGLTDGGVDENSVHWRGGWGIAVNDGSETQRGIGAQNRNGLIAPVTSDIRTSLNTNYFVRAIANTGASWEYANELTSFDDNGFTITTRDGSRADTELLFLAIKLDGFRQFSLQSYATKSGTTGELANTTPGFTPKTLLIGMTMAEAEDTIDTGNTIGGLFGLAMADRTDILSAVSRSDSGIEPPDEATLFDTKINLPNEDATTGITADIPTDGIMDATGFTLDFTAVETNAKRWWVLAIEEGDYYLTAAQGSYTITGYDATLTHISDNVLDAEAGSYTIAGQAAGLLRSLVLTAEQDSYTIAGQAAGLLRSLTIAAEQDSFTLSGQPAGLLRSLVIIAAQGSYTFSGIDATLTYVGGYELVAEAGSYSISGQATTFKRSLVLDAEIGTFTFSGVAATLTYQPLQAEAIVGFLRAGQVLLTFPRPIGGEGITGYNLTAELGSYNLAGQVSSLLRSLVLVAEQDSFTISGQPAGLLRSLVLTAEQGTLTISGQDAALTRDLILTAEQGSYNISGQDATLTHIAGYSLVAETGSYTIAGQAAEFLRSLIITAEQGSFTLSGQVASLLRGYTLNAEQGSFTLSGQAATFAKGFILTAEPGSLTISGQAIGLTRDLILAAEQGSYTFLGFASAISKGEVLNAEQGTYTLVGQATTLTRDLILTAEQGTLTFSGQAIGLTRDLILTAEQDTFTLVGQDATLTHIAGYALIAEEGSYTLVGQDATLVADRVITAGIGQYSFLSPLFSDGFETGDTSQWDNTVGTGISAHADAAILGSYGLKVELTDTSIKYVEDLTPTLEKRYRIKFYFDPNSVTMADFDQFDMMLARNNSSVTMFLFNFRYTTANGYQVRGRVRDDAAGFTNTSYFDLSDEAHLFEVYWQASSGPGNDDGTFAGWLDDVQVFDLTGIDNDTREISRFRIGACLGVDVGTSGEVYFDEFKSSVSQPSINLNHIYSLTAEPGTYTINGQDANFVVDRKLTAETGTYTFSGIDAGLAAGNTLTAEMGAYTLSGQDATLLIGYVVTAEQGSLTYTGQDIGFILDLTITAEQGIYTLVGPSIDLLYSAEVFQIYTTDAYANITPVLSSQANITPASDTNTNITPTKEVQIG